MAAQIPEKGGGMRFGKQFLVCFVVGILYLILGAPRIVHASKLQQSEGACSFLSDGLIIPDDGSWLSICWSDPSAPVGSTITELNVKML